MNSSRPIKQQMPIEDQKMENEKSVIDIEKQISAEQEEIEKQKQKQKEEEQKAKQQATIDESTFYLKDDTSSDEDEKFEVNELVMPKEEQVATGPAPFMLEGLNNEDASDQNENIEVRAVAKITRKILDSQIELKNHLFEFEKAIIEFDQKTKNTVIVNSLNNLRNTICQELFTDSNSHFPEFKNPQLNINKTPYIAILNHFTALTQQNPSQMTIEQIDQSAKQLEKTLNHYKPVSKAVKAAICGVIGAVVGFAIGVFVGAAVTVWAGGIGALPGAISGGFTGFVGGFFHAKKQHATYQHNYGRVINAATDTMEALKKSASLKKEAEDVFGNHYSPKKR